MKEDPLVWIVVIGVSFALGLLLGIWISYMVGDTINYDTLDIVCAELYGDNYVYVDNGMPVSYSFDCVKTKYPVERCVSSRADACELKGI